MVMVLGIAAAVASVVALGVMIRSLRALHRSLDRLENALGRVKPCVDCEGTGRIDGYPCGVCRGRGQRVTT